MSGTAIRLNKREEAFFQSYAELTGQPLSTLMKGVAFLQKAAIIVVILAIAPVAAAVLSLLEACVKLMTMIIDVRDSGFPLKESEKP